MSDLKPIGSEKLEGSEKIKRILEISHYKEVPKNNINETHTTEYSKTLSDGNRYIISKEKMGYVLKRSINEGTEEYLEPMKNRKFYSSYSKALKRLNLLAREVNFVNGVTENIDLFNEEKKFVLKTPKSNYDDDGLSAGSDVSMDMDLDSAPASGGDELDLDLGDDMGGDMEGGDDLGLDMGDDLGGDMEGGEDVTDFKGIQKLTGKLTQKIREYDSVQSLTSENMKYVINSILSAMDLENLDEDDKEEILERIEGESEYDDMEGDIDIDAGSDELDLDMGDEMSDEEPMEGEMAETAIYYGSDDFGYHDAKGNVIDPRDLDGLPQDNREFDFPTLHKFAPQFIDSETANNADSSVNNLRIFYPKPEELNAGAEISELDRILDSVFSESKAEKTINKYLDESVIKETKLVEAKRMKNTINNIVNLSTTYEQERTSTSFVKEFKEVKFVGRTNKQNLVFEVKGEQFKVTPEGMLL